MRIVIAFTIIVFVIMPAIIIMMILNNELHDDNGLFIFLYNSYLLLLNCCYNDAMMQCSIFALAQLQTNSQHPMMKPLAPKAPSGFLGRMPNMPNLPRIPERRAAQGGYLRPKLELSPK